MPPVLVADDDQDIRVAARTLLEAEGYAVLEAADGEEALGALRASEGPLVVLLDIGMPCLSGVDLLVLAARGDLRLARHAYLVWTALGTPLPAGLLAALGVPLLPKPYDIYRLLAAVAEAAVRLAHGEVLR